MSDLFLCLAGILLTLGTGMFVAAEFSLVSLDRQDLERRVADGEKGLGSVIQALSRTATHLSSAQLGITLTTLLAGFLLEPTFSRYFAPLYSGLSLPEAVREPLIAGTAVLVATALSMIIGELVPKNLAISKPLAVAKLVVPLQSLFTAIFKPFVILLNASANGLLRMFGIVPKEELSGARSAEELSSLVRHSATQGTLEKDTATLLDRTLRFSELTASDAMTPRPQMESIQKPEPATAVLDLAKRTGFSRFPVIDKDNDDVVGVAHLKQAIAVPRDKRDEVPVAALAEDIARVPETMPLDTLLEELREVTYQCALVVDEYGGTAGFVTLEDLVEELVGEVADEHDRSRVGIVSLRDTILIPGEMRPDQVRDEVDVDIPENPAYDTVAGFMLYELGRLPQNGDEVSLGDAGVLRIEHLDGRRIARLRFVPADDAVHPVLHVLKDTGSEVNQ